VLNSAQKNKPKWAIYMLYAGGKFLRKPHKEHVDVVFASTTGDTVE
jgi:hypothetical protein